MKPIKKKALHGKCTYSVPSGLFLPQCFTFPVSWHPQLTAGVSQLTPCHPLRGRKPGGAENFNSEVADPAHLGAPGEKEKKKANSASWVHFVGWQYLVDCSLARLFPRIVEESSQSYQFIFSVPKVFRVWHIVTSHMCNKWASLGLSSSHCFEGEMLKHRNWFGGVNQAENASLVPKKREHAKKHGKLLEIDLVPVGG